MKKLSDYQNEEAIELWADLLEPMGRIIADEGIRNSMRARKPYMVVAKEVLKNHAKDAIEIITRIDPTPVDGLNVIIRVTDVLVEISKSDDLKGFFEFAKQETMDNESSGSVTENTEGVKG